MSSEIDKVPVAIIGGGVAGLALALNLHKRKIPCRVYEAASEIREIGVGITLLPHAMREITELGLAATIRELGIENRQSSFYNRFGQLLLSEPRGVHAGYAYPEVGIHRGKLHGTLFREVIARLGPHSVITGRCCIGLEQDQAGVSLSFADAQPVRADVVVACDGVNSSIRRQFYPKENVVFSGVNTWRGVTHRPRVLDGRTYIRIGSFLSGNVVVYPIVDGDDASDNQLINWVAQIPADKADRNDWNQEAIADDFADFFDGWIYDWLNIPDLIREAPVILEYPMVDKDPVERWTFGRVTLAGDAAHPMYPRGSNGSAQALIDVRVLAERLANIPDWGDAFVAYEDERRPVTAKIVEANRSTPPDYVNIIVEQLTGDRPFQNLEDFISQEELRRLSDEYKKVAGFSLHDLKPKASEAS